MHCSDEPSADDLESYAHASGVIRRYFSKFRQIDALSDPAFLERGLVETPIPAENHLESFLGRTDRLWTYYCCGQHRDELPNRFFAIPPIRNRILGVLLYLYRCEGFLHWGYNFYYTQYSRRLADPFTETDAGGAFPSGDAFIVYPGADGEPLTSLRQQVFYAGLQDLQVLQKAEALTSREAVERLIRSTLGDVSFTSYPMDPAVFYRFKTALFDFIESYQNGE